MLEAGGVVPFQDMRNLGYYLRPAWRADFVFESYELQKLFVSSGSWSDLADFFESREVTHLLIDERATYSELALSRGQRDVLEAFLRERASLVKRIDRRALFALD